MAWCSVKAQGQLYIENKVIRKTFRPKKGEMSNCTSEEVLGLDRSLVLLV